MLACSGCGGAPRVQAVLGRRDFHVRFEPIPPGAQRGLFFCAACAEGMLALGKPVPG